MDPALESRLINSLFARNLVLVCGAGLSRAAPSNLPGAVTFAEECYDYYVQNVGPLNAALRPSLDQQARHFFQLGQFEAVFINQVVQWGRFTAAANEGHRAIADFLCCKAIRLAVSTNYDMLVEDAANGLGEKDFLSSLTLAELNQHNVRHNALLKLHGCRTRSRNETVWCTDQLASPPVQPRIAQLGNWLAANLVAKDFVFVGFWSDWDYLNQVLLQAIQAVPTPPMVVLVDPDTAAALQAKAPALWAWANASPHFFHERMSANDFLVELRTILSEQFFRQLFSAGVGRYTAVHGSAPATAAPAPNVSVDRWYDLRRDALGLLRDQPVREAAPVPYITDAGLAMVELNEKGAVLSEQGIRATNGRIVRVLGATGALSLVMQQYSKEPPARQTEDVVICACAIPDTGVTSVLRPATAKTIVRPGLNGRWVTLSDGLNLV